MVDEILPNTGIMKPHVGPGGTGNWGDKTNDNWQIVDDRFALTPPAAQVAGAGTPGASPNVARADHVHPLDFSGGSIPDGSIPYDKLDLTGRIVDADVAMGAAIAYAKLALTGSITNADLAGAISLSKLAALTADRALISSPAGVISPSPVTATELSRVGGVTSPIQTQIDAVKATADGAAASVSTVSTIDRLRPTAQGTPGTTVAVAAGVYTKSDGSATVTFAGGSSPAFAVVTANSRIDLLTIDDTGTVAITQGTQAASPVPPAYPSTKIVLAEVTISQTTGPAITQAMIKDVRPYLNLGSGGGGSSASLEYVAYTVGSASGTYSGSTTVFDLPFTYATNGKTVEVYYNGQQLKYGTDYSETSTTRITMSTALVSGAAVWFRAVVSAAAVTPTVVTLYREDFIVGTALNNYTGSLTVFDLVNTFNVGGNAIMVTLDGDVQTKGATADYLETDSNTITFNTALVAGQRISFMWATAAPSSAVNAGTAGQLAYYPASAGAVSGTDAAKVGSGGNLIAKGTTTNDSAAAGEIGEYKVATGSGNTSTNGNYGDMGNISLTAGDWDVSLFACVSRNTATWTRVDTGIGPNPTTNAAGMSYGNNLAINEFPSSASTPGNIIHTIPSYRITVIASETWYAKVRADFSTGQPQYAFRMTARRIR